MPVQNTDPCIYNFWLQIDGDQNLFVCPEDPYIGIDWDTGAFVEGSMKFKIPDNWAARKIVAVSINQGPECDQSGYLYANWENVEKDLLKGKIKGDADNLSFLAALGLAGESPGTGIPGGSGDSEDDTGIPIWFWVVLAFVSYKVIKK